jgi:Carboxypeptidase regulatory-like domain
MLDRVSGSKAKVNGLARLWATRARAWQYSSAVIALVLLVSTHVLLVQAASAEAEPSAYGISGVAQDEDGSVIPNANVTLVAERPEKTYSAQTDAKGRFRFKSLTGGSYHIKVEEQGFHSFEKWILIRAVREFQLRAIMPVVQMRQVAVVQILKKQLLTIPSTSPRSSNTDPDPPALG